MSGATWAIAVAHDAEAVLLWRSPTSQRVVRLHASGPTLLHRLAERGDPPLVLDAVWLHRIGFDALLAQALPDPDALRPGAPSTMSKAERAQHRLTTRYAQVRVGWDLEHRFDGAVTSRHVPWFGLQNAARHTAKQWILRVDEVDVTSWSQGCCDEAYEPHSYPVDPAIWHGWTLA